MVRQNVSPEKVEVEYVEQLHIVQRTIAVVWNVTRIAIAGADGLMMRATSHQDKQQPSVENVNMDCPPDQGTCPRQNWGTSREDQHEGQKECAKCWNHYKNLHKQEKVEVPEEKMLEVEERIPSDSVEKEVEPEPELYEEVFEKTDIDIAREENQKAQIYLEMAEKEFGQNDIRIRKQKILVAALAGYIHNLDTVMNPPEEPKQPELPKLKNNDQRKEWLRNYKDWGLWYHDDRIDVNYYKYDFEDGSRLVVAEYPKMKVLLEFR